MPTVICIGCGKRYFSKPKNTLKEGYTPACKDCKLDPDVLPRCQAVSNHNVQCKHAALWGTEYCQHHKRIDQRKEVVE